MNSNLYFVLYWMFGLAVYVPCSLSLSCPIFSASIFSNYLQCPCLSVFYSIVATHTHTHPQPFTPRSIPTLAYNLMSSLSELVRNSTSRTAPTKEMAESSEKARIRSHFDDTEARSPSEEFKFEVPKNPYVSPYYASDEALKQLPPVKIVVSGGGRFTQMLLSLMQMICCRP